ncbi:MAG: molecular chaperone TorD family protein [Bacteriovoracaceae bacterium]|jgi:putative dimethyl sulfoxide reductase chaperone|nr:molecular chaperone TorD family protein [Bacteriovoracaceae bacterium]
MKDSRLEEIKSRKNLYFFLSKIFERELISKDLEILKDLEIFGALGLDFSVEGDFIESLSVEFARLFIGPGSHISAYESVHSPTGDGQLYGKVTSSVENYYQSFGLIKSTPELLPDHISIELEFMTLLLDEELKANLEGDSEREKICTMRQKQFFNNHLANWIPIFCKKLGSFEPCDFYSFFANFTDQFIEAEREVYQSA